MECVEHLCCWKYWLTKGHKFLRQRMVCSDEQPRPRWQLIAHAVSCVRVRMFVADEYVMEHLCRICLFLSFRPYRQKNAKTQNRCVNFGFKHQLLCSGVYLVGNLMEIAWLLIWGPSIFPTSLEKVVSLVAADNNWSPGAEAKLDSPKGNSGPLFCKCPLGPLRCVHASNFHWRNSQNSQHKIACANAKLRRFWTLPKS